MTDATAVDTYFERALHPSDPQLDSLLAANAAAGLPAHDVAPNQGRLLTLLARMCGARRILELGTLGGFSTLFLARALPLDGVVVTLERSPHHAAVARANLSRAGVADRVDLRLGDAVQTLDALIAAGEPPFDLVFLDADKAQNAACLPRCLALSRAGTILIADNVVRAGAVADAGDPDPRVQGIRRFTELIAADPRLEATVIQTVGTKGHDGFLLATVTAERR